MAIKKHSKKRYPFAETKNCLPEYRLGVYIRNVTGRLKKVYGWGLFG